MALCANPARARRAGATALASGEERRTALLRKDWLAMIQSNLKTVSRTNRGSRTGSRRAPREGYTVARYRLLLVKEDEETVSEPESLTRPAEVAAFLWERVFAGLDREAMCAVYADNLCHVIGWTVALCRLSHPLQCRAARSRRPSPLEQRGIGSHCSQPPRRLCGAERTGQALHQNDGGRLRRAGLEARRFAGDR